MEKRFEDVIVTSNIELEVSMQKRTLQEAVFEYEFDLSWNEEQAEEENGRVSLQWRLPNGDVQYMWHPTCGARRVLDGDWRLNMNSMLTASAPVALLFNNADENIYTFAIDEIKKVAGVRFGVNDTRDDIAGEISMGLKQFAGRSSDKLLVRADFRRIPYYQALDGVRAWWEKVLDLEPAGVPDVARNPVYSSWYSFHQKIQAAELEEECVRAKALGMDAIIVDDGWQTADSGGRYGHTGDWEPCSEKIPDMRAHVQRVHEAGLKYILWYSVPYVGFYSKNWERFKDKVLYTVDRNYAGVLDPRYPEVREFLIGTYENAMAEYDLDGFKLDFVDLFHMPDRDERKPGMDYDCVQEATERLLTDVMKRLRARKADVMIEFRQRYIGPGMRRFGNMFRVSDCASDIATNRVGIVDLRILSGNTAVHSDMLTWSNAEKTENAALQILNVIFGVIQLSKVLGEMTPEHREMVAFWLKFARENRRILQESELIPYEPQFLYPVIKACDDREEIIGVYAKDKIIHPDFAKDRIQIINATKQGSVYLAVEKECSAEWKAFDTRGHMVDMGILERREGNTEEENAVLRREIEEIPVPQSGLLDIHIRS